MDQIEFMNNKKKAIIEMSSLIDALNKYNSGVIDKRSFLNIVNTYNNYYPLPSGKWGNKIALALELNYYIAAVSLLKDNNSEKCDNIACDYDGSNPVNIDDVLLLSSLTKISYEDIEDIPGFIKGKRIFLKNDIAYLFLLNTFVDNKNKEMTK